MSNQWSRRQIRQQQGALTIEFMLLMPLVLLVFIVAFAVGRLFILEAVLEWNLHKISRQISITPESSIQAIALREFDEHNFGLFDPAQVQLTTKACPTLLHWHNNDCVTNSTGLANWVVEYRVSYELDLLALAAVRDQRSKKTRTLIKIVRNEPKLPTKAETFR